ncbi:ArsR family transcriptional regulator [Candidatus Woesearchaeota archaeon]|nr:ArsR family transcriptional regulator [Candidatus Woesearchaeota archaeon]
MYTTFKKITLLKIKKPQNRDLNADIQWLSQSLGLFNLRDKEKSCFRIFVELLKCTKKDNPISSDELAFKLNLSRGTIVHHLNKLISAGFVVSTHNKYILRTKTLKELVELIKKDVNESFSHIEEAAKEIDQSLNWE